MCSSETELLYLSQENKSTFWPMLEVEFFFWGGEGVVLLNVNILMKREVFFFPPTYVSVDPV